MSATGGERLRAPDCRDICPRDTLQVAWLVSPHVHARLASLEARWARDLEGVAAVLTSADLVPPRRSLLQAESVRFPGDLVGIVAASDPEIAAEAVQKIDVQYEGLSYLSAVPRLSKTRSQEELFADCEVLDRWTWQKGASASNELPTHFERRFPVWSRQAFEAISVVAMPDSQGGVRLASSSVDAEGRFGTWLRNLLGARGPRLRLEALAEGCPVPRRSGWEIDGLAALLSLECRQPVRVTAPIIPSMPDGAFPVPPDAGCQLCVELEFDSNGRPTHRRVRAIVDAGARLGMGSDRPSVPALADFLPFHSEDWQVTFVASHRASRCDVAETVGLIDQLATNLSASERSSVVHGAIGETPGWKAWSEGLLRKVPLDSEHELFGVGRSLARMGTGWIAHEVALGMDLTIARPRVLRWRVRNASDVDARSIRAQVAAEVDWLWRRSDQDLLTYWPTSETLPEIEVSEAEGSRGLIEAGMFPGAAAAAYLNALQEILADRQLEALPLSESSLFDLLLPEA